jgi:hypothetical protein
MVSTPKIISSGTIVQSGMEIPMNPRLFQSVRPFSQYLAWNVHIGHPIPDFPHFYPNWTHYYTLSGFDCQLDHFQSLANHCVSIDTSFRH